MINGQTSNLRKKLMASCVAFYHNANGGGSCFDGAPNTNAPWFAFWDDNKVSSFQLGRSCG